MGKPKEPSEYDRRAKENVQVLMKRTPAPVQEVNKKFPIKKAIADESGWDRFKNSLGKGWDSFQKWGQKHLGPLKGIITMITDFLPMGSTIKNAINKVVGIGDKITGGSKDYSLYDILFIYRNSIVALLFKLAIDYKMPVDTAEFKKLFHTTPEFKQYLEGAQGGEFYKTLVQAEEAAQKVITGNNEAKVPENRKEAQQQASQLIVQHEKTKTADGQPMVVGKKDMYKWLT